MPVNFLYSMNTLNPSHDRTEISNNPLHNDDSVRKLDTLCNNSCAGHAGNIF